MKLIGTEYNEQGEVAFVTLGDHALLRNNDDFYIPDFTSQLTLAPQLVLRVGKVGKGIAPRFASRYIDAVGVGARFYAEDRIEELKRKSLPTEEGYGFDHAAAISPMQPLAENQEIDKLEYLLKVNGMPTFSGALKELPFSWEELVARISSHYMLKVGDFIYCGSRFRYLVKKDDLLEVLLDGERWMYCRTI